MFRHTPALVTILALAPACFLVDKDVLDPSASIPDGGIPPGAGVGSSCSRESQCRTGLACAPDSRTCQPTANKVPGAGCILSAECLPGNYCSPFAQCAPGGKAPEGAQCTTEGDCAPGLVCNLTGLSGSCAKAGTGDLGVACAQTSDCRGGLLCVARSCQAFLTVKPWEGAKCPEEKDLPPKIHFRVPRAGDSGDDFYRLPFPNDIRKKNGKVSLTGHPRPGARFLPFDPVERYFEAIEAESTGFGTNQAVFFRFSRDPNFDSIKKAGGVAIYNITPGSPEYGLALGHSWHANTGGGRYICPRFMVVRHWYWDRARRQGYADPLRPGTTYAVVLGRVITDAAGATMEPDDDFKAMLAGNPPAGPELAAAWQAYAPLRAWIADKKVDAGQMTAAAVFTTEKVDEPVARLREAVRAAPAPEIKGAVRCGDAGARSPCQPGCPATPDPAFDELQGTVGIPVFQKGTPPYEQPSDGGGIEFDTSGRPRLVRTEDVCFSLTVPKGAAPAAGWPVVVYGHGTGGDYRSHVDTRLAADFATGDVGGAARAPMAMLGYDGVLHGPRRGASTKAPDELVYNFLNPRAARDNALQGAADLFAIARALETFSAGGVRIDKAKMGLYGHSQGGNAAATAVAREPTFGAVALSGTGGTLIYTLLLKTKPVNVPAVLPFALGEERVDENHQILNLLQMFFERSDPLNHARAIFAAPPMGVPARHALHIYGADDTYSPVETQLTLAQAAGFPVVAPVVEKFGLQEIMAPVKANFLAPGGNMVTAVQAQYAPSGYDGHFVSTENPSARRAVRQMLGTFVRDGVPTVTP